MTVLRLWPPELDPLCDEARGVVAMAVAAIGDQYKQRALPLDRDERVAEQRALIARTYVSRPEARERYLAGVRCLVTTPEQGPASAVYLHFHGGGMNLGAPEMSTLGNLDVSWRHNVAVVSVDYRLAPEHPFPAGPDDCLAVATWVFEHGAREFGTDRVLIGGESAGGYLAAAVLLRVRDELGADVLARVIGANLVYGVFDWGGSPSQRGLRPHDEPDVLDPSDIAFFTDCFLPGRTAEERRDPSISPAFADLAGMPPALFSVGSGDHLLDDTLHLAHRWAAVSHTELFVAPYLPHGFTVFPCAITDHWTATSHAWFDARLAG